MANVLTQNKLSEAMPQLPASVKTYGVAVKKALAFPLLVISNQVAERDVRQQLPVELHDDQHPGQPGPHQGRGPDQPVRRVRLRDARLAEADRIARLGITVPDIVNAISQQNTLSPSASSAASPPCPTRVHLHGADAGPPPERGRVRRRHRAVEPDGSQVRLRDVARIELGHAALQRRRRHDAKPAAVLAVFQIPGTNALQVAKDIKAELETLSKRFPRDLEYKVSLDTTLPVEEGINEIVQTLLEAVVLVIIVVFVFLQNWRATLIPLMTVPVSLVGAFIFFPLLGFSINVLSLLGLVLAIGIVVDDAIVVVEAVMHHIEHGMTPKEATFKAMEEVSGPVVAIALILAAVFVPVGFMGGISGMLYQQFAITIAISVLCPRSTR